MSRRHRVEQSVYSRCDAREAGRRIIISPVASHGRSGNLSLSARVPAAPPTLLARAGEAIE